MCDTTLLLYHSHGKGRQSFTCSSMHVMITHCYISTCRLNLSWLKYDGMCGLSRTHFTFATYMYSLTHNILFALARLRTHVQILLLIIDVLDHNINTMCHTQHYYTYIHSIVLSNEMTT